MTSSLVPDFRPLPTREEPLSTAVRPLELAATVAAGKSPSLDAAAAAASSRTIAPLRTDPTPSPFNARESTCKPRGTASAATATVGPSMLALLEASLAPKQEESVRVAARDRKDAPDRERHDDMPSVDGEGRSPLASGSPLSVASTSAARHGGRGKQAPPLLLPIAGGNSCPCSCWC